MSLSASSTASVLVAAGLLLSGCALAPTPYVYTPPVAAVDRPGGGIAAYRCAACHTVQGREPGRNRAAPAFRDLARRYDKAMLASVLQETARQGHGQMPPFQFSPSEVEVLVAYISAAR